VETAGKAEISINSGELSTFANRNDGTFRNLVENLSSARTEGFVLTPENFRDTLKGTWQKRYHKAMQKYPEAKYVYDAIELLRNTHISIRFSTVLRVSQIIAQGNIFHKIKNKLRILFALRQLIRTEDILHPRDGQIEAKGYKINSENYLSKLYFEIGKEYYSTDNIFIKFFYFYAMVFTTPKSFFEDHKLSLVKRLYGSIFSIGAILNNIGHAYNFFGFPENALILLRNSVEIKNLEIDSLFYRKRLATSWHGLGESFFQLKRHNEAISAYKKAIELAPKYVSPWLGLGRVYYHLNQYEEAIQAYQKAIELKPKDASIWDDLGDAYRDLELHDDAIQAYQKAIELDLEFASPWGGLGNLYSIQQDTQKAFIAYKKAVELSPEKGSYRASLIGSLRKLGRETEALEQEKVTRSFFDNESDYNRACLEAVCGNTEEALRLLKIALEQKQISLAWVQKDPDLDFIREDARFNELAQLE
jgi:tetratricopeptide (TPR) repeat protein